jgi:hypothetical protein
MTTKTLKKAFADRGLVFTPVNHPNYGKSIYEYRGQVFETWKVEGPNGSLGVFTFIAGSYPTRRKMSDNFDPYRTL